MIKLCQRIAGVIDVWVGHRRVFTQNIHGRNFTIMSRIHNFRHGQAFFSQNIVRFPDFIKGRAHTLIGHALIIWQKHRDQPSVRRALHVVLAT